MSYKTPEKSLKSDQIYSDGAEDYLIINNSDGGKWADVSENTKAWFFCQKA